MEKNQLVASKWQAIAELEEEMSQILDRLEFFVDNYLVFVNRNRSLKYPSEPMSKKEIICLIDQVNQQFKNHLTFYQKLASDATETKKIIINIDTIYQHAQIVGRLCHPNALIGTLEKGLEYPDIFTHQIDTILRNYWHSKHLFVLKLIKDACKWEIITFEINGELGDLEYQALGEFVDNNNNVREMRLIKSNATLSSPFVKKFVNLTTTSPTLFILMMGIKDNILSLSAFVNDLEYWLANSAVKNRFCIALEMSDRVYGCFKNQKKITTALLMLENINLIAEEIKSSNSLDSVFLHSVPGVDIEDQAGPQQNEIRFLCAYQLIHQDSLNLGAAKYGDDGWRAIDYALKDNNYWAVFYFLHRNASVTIRNKDITSLHIAAKYADDKILELLLNQPLIRSCIDCLDKNEHSALEIAITETNTASVEVLLRAYPNLREDNRYMTIALNNDDFEIAQKLINADVFIGAADRDRLLALIASEGDQNSPSKGKFKALLLMRKQFFDAVRIGSIDIVTQSISSSDSGIIHWHDFENNSALYVAYAARQYEMYGFLVSRYFHFSQDVLQALPQNVEENNKFSEAALKWLKNPDRALAAHYCSHTTNRDEQGKITDSNKLFSELIANSQIKPIFEVVKYSPSLEIYIDYASESIQQLDPNSSEKTMGILNSTLLRVILGGNANFSELCGTAAHEFTHLACLLLFQNKCLPYKEHDAQSKKAYEDAFYALKDRYDDKSKRKQLDTVISRVFKVYKNEEDQKAELIVRIPHILARDGFEAGLKLLEYQVPDLLSFYQSRFLTACSEFVKSKLIENQNTTPSHIILQDELKRRESSHWHLPSISNTLKYTGKATILCFAAYGIISFFRSQPKSAGGEDSNLCLDYKGLLK